VQFHEYPPQEWSALLPALSEAERDLVGSLVRYESGTRLSAANVRLEAKEKIMLTNYSRFSSMNISPNDE
jgi:hypothetical protein